MAWDVVLVAEFSEWLAGLEVEQRRDVLASLVALEAFGPQLGRPRVDTLKGSAVSNLKELRVQSAGRPLRCLFAFDPKRQAVVLLGGDKGGDKRWYEVNIPIAEARFAQHLEPIEGDQ